MMYCPSNKANELLAKEKLGINFKINLQETNVFLIKDALENKKRLCKIV